MYSIKNVGVILGLSICLGLVACNDKNEAKDGPKQEKAQTIESLSSLIKKDPKIMFIKKDSSYFMHEVELKPNGLGSYTNSSGSSSARWFNASKDTYEIYPDKEISSLGFHQEKINDKQESFSVKATVKKITLGVKNNQYVITVNETLEYTAHGDGVSKASEDKEYTETVGTVKSSDMAAQTSHLRPGATVVSKALIDPNSPDHVGETEITLSSLAGEATSGNQKSIPLKWSVKGNEALLFLSDSELTEVKYTFLKGDKDLTPVIVRISQGDTIRIFKDKIATNKKLEFTPDMVAGKKLKGSNGVDVTYDFNADGSGGFKFETTDVDTGEKEEHYNEWTWEIRSGLLYCTRILGAQLADPNTPVQERSYELMGHDSAGRMIVKRLLQVKYPEEMGQEPNAPVMNLHSFE